MLDEVEKGRLRPLQVIEGENDRPTSRERLDQLPYRPERLLRRRLRVEQPDGRGEPAGDEGRPGLGRDELGDPRACARGVEMVADRCGPADDVDERPER